MNYLTLSLSLLCSVSLLFCAPLAAAAQQDGCPAIVYYGSIGESKGQDVGACQTAEQACATQGYALEQGKQTCSQEVHIFYVDQNREFEEAEWRPQTTPNQEFMDSIRVLLPWFGSALGLLAGWLVAVNLRRVIETR